MPSSGWKEKRAAAESLRAHLRERIRLHPDETVADDLWASLAAVPEPLSWKIPEYRAGLARMRAVRDEVWERCGPTRPLRAVAQEVRPRPAAWWQSLAVTLALVALGGWLGSWLGLSVVLGAGVGMIAALWLARAILTPNDNAKNAPGNLVRAASLVEALARRGGNSGGSTLSERVHAEAARCERDPRNAGDETNDEVLEALALEWARAGRS